VVCKEGPFDFENPNDDGFRERMGFAVLDQRLREYARIHFSEFKLLTYPPLAHTLYAFAAAFGLRV